MRKLFHAGAAISSPEVDEYWLAAVIGKMELAAVQAGDHEILELLPDLAALRRRTGVVSLRSRFGLSFPARRSLLIQGFQHLRGYGTALVVHDFAVAVQDDGLRHGGGPAHEIPDCFVVVFNGKWHHPVASVLIQVFLRILIHDVGVQRQHGDVALMSFVQLAEMRKLFHAGAAISSPEVDEHRLAAVIGKMELASVQTGDREVLELLSDFAADRRIT